MTRNIFQALVFFFVLACFWIGINQTRRMLNSPIPTSSSLKMELLSVVENVSSYYRSPIEVDTKAFAFTDVKTTIYYMDSEMVLDQLSKNFSDNGWRSSGSIGKWPVEYCKDSLVAEVHRPKKNKSLNSVLVVVSWLSNSRCMDSIGSQ